MVGVRITGLVQGIIGLTIASRTFLTCVVVFEVGSALCGAAPSSVAFIVGRAIAGLASAGIFSGSMMIMIPMIPLHKRPMFQGKGAHHGINPVPHDL